MPFSLVCREIKKTKNKDEQFGPEDVFSPMPPSERLKMLVSTMMTGHDDGHHTDGPIGKVTWDVSRAHLYGDAHRSINTSLLGEYQQKGKLTRLCRSIYGTRGAPSIWGDTWSEASKNGSMNVGSACLIFFCSQEGHLKGLCHGDDFCVVARRKQLQIFGNVLEKTVSGETDPAHWVFLQKTRRS